MHIVYIMIDFPVANLFLGGGGVYTYNMAKIMVSHGHEVDVFVESSDKYSLCDYEGIHIHSIPVKTPWKDDKKKWPAWKKIWKNCLRAQVFSKELKKLHKNSPVDLVQSIEARGYAMNIKSIPYIIRFSSWLPFYEEACNESFSLEEVLRKRKSLDTQFVLRTAKNAAALLAPSNLVAGVVQKEMKRNVFVVESPVCVDAFADLSLNENGLLPGKYLFDFGALHYRKEIHIISRICDGILDEHPDFKIVFCGKSRLLRRSEGYIQGADLLNQDVKKHKDKVVYLGEVLDRRRLFSLIKNSYACVLPTRVDNLPNAVLESMALGKVVVSTTSEYGTSVEQLITDGYNGFLAKVDDEESLFSKIKAALDLSESEKLLMEQRAKERVKDLMPEKVYEKMIKIYNDVIAGARA